jgi:hypothetical protein
VKKDDKIRDSVKKNGKKKIDTVQDAKLALVKKKYATKLASVKKRKKWSKELCGLKPVGGIVVWCHGRTAGHVGKKRR